MSFKCLISCNRCNIFNCYTHQDRFSEISAAIEENLLDALRLKPVTDDESWLENYFGSIKGKDEEKIYIELYEQSYLSFKKVYKTQPFDIFFRFNRLSFRMQHYALDLMRDHRLFNQLIDNPAYDENVKYEPNKNHDNFSLR